MTKESEALKIVTELINEMISAYGMKAVDTFFIENKDSFHDSWAEEISEWASECPEDE